MTVSIHIILGDFELDIEIAVNFRFSRNKFSNMPRLNQIWRAFNWGFMRVGAAFSTETL